MVLQVKECEVVVPILIALSILFFLIWLVKSLYNHHVFITVNDQLRSIIEGEIAAILTARRLLESGPRPELNAFLTNYIDQGETRILQLQHQIELINQGM